MTALGQRVQVGDFYAIIKYMGPVSGTDGEWLGVEWEEEGRGKHDGSYKNVKYFNAKPLHGSFVREHKLKPGKSFSEVLQQRYTDVTGVGDAMSIINKDNTSTNVELVGLSNADISRAAQLTHLVMREESIVSVGDTSFIAEKCVNTENLDMSLNLFYDINDILKIIQLMPKLRSTQLKGNVLTSRKICTVEQPHSSLEKIYLAGTGLSWEEFCKLAEQIPNVREVYISGATLDIGNTPSNILQNLTFLDVQYSGISNWNSLDDISKLPNLQTLILSNNTISSIKLEPEQFSKLNALSLDNNKLSQWSSVAELRKLTLLKTLRIRSNPLITGPALDMRLLVVAMLPDVQKLNGTPISDNERLQADIFYLKHFAAEYYKEDPGFHTVHNRYKDLVKEYGEPDTGMPKIASIKDQSILVKIAKPDGKEFEKKLLKTTLVKNLHLIVQRQCKILPKNQKLYWIDSLNEKIALDDPTRDLAYFNISHDVTVYVET